MSVQDQDEGTRTAFAILIPLLVLVVGFVVGVGIHKAKGSAPKAVAVAAAPAANATDEPKVVIDGGVVKFYFASGKADLAAGAVQALGEAVKAATEGKTLQVSGFHDATGNAEVNAEVAKLRALAVREALMSAGVAEARIVLRKPEELLGAAVNAEARRVDVVIQ